MWQIRETTAFQIFDSAGNYQSEFNGPGSGDNTLRWPTDIALDSMGGVYVTSLTSYQIYVERDTHSFEVQNPANGRLAVSIPANSVHDAAGNGNTASNTVSVTVTGSSVVIPTVTAPSAPTNLLAITTSDTTVTLSWTTPTSDGGAAITHYNLEQRIGGTNWVDSNPVSSVTSPATVSGLTSGQTYQFRVIATNGAHLSEPSNVVSATLTTTPQPPGAPTGLTATVGDGTITLSWTAPTNIGGSAIASYTIQQSTNAGNTWTASIPPISAGTTVTVTGLTNDQIYHFRVNATNAQGAGTASNIVIATPTASAQQSTAPSAPTNLLATVGNTQITLSWTAPTNTGSSTIIRYNIEQSTDGTSWTASTPATATGLTQTVTGLTNGQEYQFRVSATNDQLTGGWSISVSATPNTSSPIATVPDAPTYPSFWITDDATEVRLYWNVPANDGDSDITAYKTQYKIATNSDWTDGPTGLAIPAIISNLTPGLPHEFRVFAVNSEGTSEPSLVTSATLVPRQPTTVPGAPTNLQATAGNAQVELEWTAPSTGGSTTGYKVEQSTDGTSWTASAFTVSGTTATVTGLTNDVQYSFRVLATNSVGDSDPSNVDTATPVSQQTATVPGAPKYPSFWLTDDATTVHLYWDPPTNDGGSVITAYKTQYKIATATSWTDGPMQLSIPAFIPNLTPGLPHEFRVFAVNSEGTSEPSLVTSATLVPRN